MAPPCGVVCGLFGGCSVEGVAWCRDHVTDSSKETGRPAWPSLQLLSRLLLVGHCGMLPGTSVGCCSSAKCRLPFQLKLHNSMKRSHPLKRNDLSRLITHIKLRYREEELESIAVCFPELECNIYCWLWEVLSKFNIACHCCKYCMSMLCKHVDIFANFSMSKFQIATKFAI